MKLAMSVTRKFALTSTLCLALGSAYAQEKVVEKAIEARTGEPIQLGVYGRVTPKCQNAKVSIKVPEKPINGTATAKRAKLKAGAIAKCPSLISEAVVIFYQSNEGFIGNDRVSVVVETDAGQMQRSNFMISVK